MSNPLPDWRRYTDKFTSQVIYLRVYHMIVPKPCESVLEIGVDCGAGYLFWKELFGVKRVTGIDNRTMEQCCEFKKPARVPLPVPTGEDVFIHSPFDKVDEKQLPQFDMIVDDASHWLEHQIAAFNKFLPNLRKGGVYVIEDIPHNPADIIAGTTGDKRHWVIFDMKPQTGRVDGLMMAYFNDVGMATPYAESVFKPKPIT